MRLRAAARRWLGAALVAPVMTAGASEGLEWLYDVPFVPTPPHVVDKMLDMAKVGPKDFLIDLGSGDGRIPIRAAKRFGTRGLGIEIDPPLVAGARANARREGVANLVEFREENLYVAEFGDATVLTMYLLPQVIHNITPKLLALRPGTRIVSHDFRMNDWAPDETTTIPVPDKPYGDPVSQVYLWVVPARAAGTWAWQEGDTPVELTLEQRFQMVEGTVASAQRRQPIEKGRLRGEEIGFMLSGTPDGAPPRLYRGRVQGDVIEGTVTAAGREAPWRAVRRASAGRGREPQS